MQNSFKARGVIHRGNLMFIIWCLGNFMEPLKMKNFVENSIFMIMRSMSIYQLWHILDMNRLWAELCSLRLFPVSCQLLNLTKIRRYLRWICDESEKKFGTNLRLEDSNLWCGYNQFFVLEFHILMHNGHK